MSPVPELSVATISIYGTSEWAVITTSTQRPAMNRTVFIISYCCLTKADRCCHLTTSWEVPFKILFRNIYTVFCQRPGASLSPENPPCQWTEHETGSRPNIEMVLKNRINDGTYRCCEHAAHPLPQTRTRRRDATHDLGRVKSPR